MLTFFTPIQSRSTTLLSVVDDYFHLGSKKAYIIKSKNQNNLEKLVLAPARANALMTCLKIISYFTLILPLLALITKAIMRAAYDYKCVNIEKKLSKNIKITPEIEAQLKEVIPFVKNKENHEKIDWICKDNNLVFNLKILPNIVFKLAPERLILMNGEVTNANQLADLRVKNACDGKAITMAHELNQLIIPETKKVDIDLEGKQYSLIAEKNLTFEKDEKLQENLYQQRNEVLDKTVDQLATFIFHSGFNDVTWRNMPLDANYHAILLDLEYMFDTTNGFIGDRNLSCGLIRCLPLFRLEAIVKKALSFGLNANLIQKAKEERLRELQIKNV